MAYNVELSRQARKFLQKLQKSEARKIIELVENLSEKSCFTKAEKEGLEPTQVSFIQRDVRELSELGVESNKKYLRALVDFEYLELNSDRKNGTRYSYQLRDAMRVGIPDTVLLTAEELEKEFSKQPM